MPVLPFHRYLGPGNDKDNGDPVDEDDRIAESHDSAYETAVSAEDILHADETAISDFFNSFASTGNLHSLIGAAGLTLKNQLEKRVGILYPDMSSHRDKYKPLTFKTRSETRQEQQRSNRQGEQDVRRDRMQDTTQPSTSHDVSDIGQDETDNNAPMSTDAVDAPQNENMPSHNGVTNPGTSMAPLYLNKSLSSPSLVFFKKSRLMHTWGFASSKYPRGRPGEQVNDYFAYTTSLAYLPVDWIPFYLSPAEYQNLPYGSYIKEVYVEVIPKGVRCSFDTGSTLTGSANSMHVIFGKHCVGLNHKVDMVNMVLKQKEASPMTIENIEDIKKNEFTDRFYGKPDEFHSKNDVTFPTSWGANRALPVYACIMGSTNESKRNSYYVESGWPRLDMIINRYNLNEHINVPCIKYSYKPRNGTLKHRYHSAIVPNKVMPMMGHTQLGVNRSQYIQDGAFAYSNLNMRPLLIKKDQIFEYESICSGPQLQGTKAQPQIHFGIEPVQANAPSDTKPNFVNASAEYEIKCSCVIGIKNDGLATSHVLENKTNFISGYKDTNQHYYLQQNHVGGYYSYNWSGKYDTSS